MAGMIPEGAPEEARNIDAFASMVYSARRALATVNGELERRGMSLDDANDWMLLRLLQVEGSNQINKLAFELAMEKKQILRQTERIMNDGLIVFTDTEDTPRFRRTIAITETGQAKLAAYESSVTAVAEDAVGVVPGPRMIGIAKGIMSLSRGLKKLQKDTD